jgi:hypothetical protein
VILREPEYRRALLTAVLLTMGGGMAHQEANKAEPA